MGTQRRASKPEAPRLGSLELGKSGAAFETTTPARANTDVRVGSWRAFTARGLAIVVLRGRVQSYETAVKAALPRAELALDKLSIRGIDDLALAVGDHEHLAWWPYQGRTTLRIVSTSFVTLPVFTATVTVRDATGRIVRQPSPPRVPWHPSFRFLRLSQLSLDLFDACRNAYLALEAILADQTPMRRKGPGVKGEQEGEWFRRALVASGVSLADFVKAAKGSEADKLYDILYRDLRVRIFHAKPGRDSMLPRDRATLTTLERGLELMTRLYLGIVQVFLGTGRLSSGFTAYAAGVMAAALLDDLTFVATADESRFDPEAEAIGGLEELHSPFPNRLSPVYEGFTARRMAWAEAADLRDLPYIRRVVGVGPDNRPRLQTSLEARLSHAGLARIEIEFRLRMRNAQALPTGRV